MTRLACRNRQARTDQDAAAPRPGTIRAAATEAP
jgi:hypothetical protein